MRRILWLLLLGLILRNGTAQSFAVGVPVLGYREFVEYIPGNLPVIISAPHGGSLEPLDLKDRNCPGCTYVTDANTRELALQIREAFLARTGGNCMPHLIINHLRRTKLDANRDLGEAADGDTQAARAWGEYHQFIDSAKAAVQRQFGRGIFIDLHGHGHTIQRLELGYLLSAASLRENNAYLNAGDVVAGSSIRQLVSDNRGQIDHAALLRGGNSLGSLLDNAGYPAVPSQNDPAPRSGDPYFSGGYNTERHGSAAGGVLDAIQIECNFLSVRDSEGNRAFFSRALAESLETYLELHYPGIESLVCLPTGTGDNSAEQENWRVGPNPSCGWVEVQTTRAGTLEVYDPLGRRQRAWSMLAGTNRVALPETNGIFLLVWKVDGRILGHQLLLQQCR
ncbi:MAG: hypothetical protein H6555_05125 [Lewinellaceae bacterium]|nr:hypothetical protein [Lewinellaceae bacterium]